MTIHAIYNLKGGVGKTTAAVNLASLAAGEARTLLWDLDPQGAASLIFRVQPQVAGFGRSVVADGAKWREAIRGTDHDGLDLLPADFAYRKLDRFLDRFDSPGRTFEEALQAIAGDYEHVFLDCAPGFSGVTEAILAAVDVVVAPVIPTVLSLHTLARVARQIPDGVRLSAFLSMVDERNALHCRVRSWARQRLEVFLQAEIPLSTVVEEVSVRRMPLVGFAAGDPSTLAFAALWRELGVRCGDAAPGDTIGPLRRSLDKLLLDLAVDPSIDVPLPLALNSERMSAGYDAGSRGREIRLRVDSARDFEALALASRSELAPTSTLQLEHFFDTTAGQLRRNGYLLRLKEEKGRFHVIADAPCPEAVSATAAEVRVDASWAARMLAGDLSPLTVLERRLAEPDRGLLPELQALIGGQTLRRVGSYQNVRQRWGPVRLTVDDCQVEVFFEFDRTESPDGRVDYEVEVGIDGISPEGCARALRELFGRAQVRWQPGTSKAERLLERLADDKRA